ncbi:MAG: peptide-methionine (S)-S-oxide reductase MsrA [Acidimicrobiia bacterium]
MFKRRGTSSRASGSTVAGRSAPIVISGIHVVDGSSMIPPFPAGSETISFGMGCFWGAERIFWQIPGVITTAVGYQGGTTENPTYEEVCTGRTGHTEAVLAVYDPAAVSLDVLMKHFWEQHDPTTLNRQGNDVGTQYRSAVYWTTEGQRDAVESSKAAYGAGLTEAGYGAITTEVLPAAQAGPFYYAEEYHQQYLHKNPRGYCNHGFCQIPCPPPAGAEHAAGASKGEQP